jgi:DNA-binding MarR family transcriptional regulator
MDRMEPSVLEDMRLIEKFSHAFLLNELIPLGINRYEMSVLMAVYKKDGIPRREILAESYGEETGIGVAIKSLDQKGYILRRRDPGDRRSQVIYITEKGLAIKEDIIKINRALESHLTRDLTQRELELFTNVIATLCTELHDTIRISGER